jgi:hypothetical protein
LNVILTAVGVVYAAGSDLRPEFDKASCDSGQFPIDALTSPTGAQRAHNQAARVLRELIRDPSSNPYIEGRVPKKHWRLLRRDRSTALYGAGGARRIAALGLKRHAAGNWKYDVLDSTCRPEVVKDGMAPADWRLDPAAPVPTPASTTVEILVTEHACASGDGPAGRVLAPVIHYGKRSVTATYFVQPKPGPQTCQGNPPGRVTLTLRRAARGPDSPRWRGRRAQTAIPPSVASVASPRSDT